MRKDRHRSPHWLACPFLIAFHVMLKDIKLTCLDLLYSADKIIISRNAHDLRVILYIGTYPVMNNKNPSNRGGMEKRRQHNRGYCHAIPYGRKSGLSTRSCRTLTASPSFIRNKECPFLYGMGIPCEKKSQAHIYFCTPILLKL